MTPTPHIEAKPGEIAKTVLMPGDPLRAKFVAETFLENALQYNGVRGMLGFTGTYAGKQVSVQGSGMGIPSMAIYSHELFAFYDVKTIIRIGTAGALDPALHIGDIVLAMGACTDSHYGAQYQLPGTFAPLADYTVLETAVAEARRLNLTPRVGNVLTSDVFYGDDPTSLEKWQRMGVLAAEMECAGLYMNAARLGKRALGILTISDVIPTGEAADAETRRTAFTAMMELALATAVNV